ncbi:MAG: hypothetical protein ACPGEC_00990 [Flavobacteriales bacterium]
MLIIVVLACFAKASAQKSIKDSLITFPLIHAGLSLHQPNGDLQERFGTSSAINLGFHYKMKSNISYGLNVQFLTGDNVKNTNQILGDVTTDLGPITNDGMLAVMSFEQRGMNINLSVGKVFSIGVPNKNSGIWLQAGAGYYWNKIKISTNNFELQVLSKDFLKGYDELRAGFSTNQSLGYLYLSNKRLLNFSIAIEAIQAFATDQRGYNYRTRSSKKERYVDHLVGLRATWYFPLYKRSVEVYQYY